MGNFRPAHRVRAHRPCRFRPQVWELESRVVPGFLARVGYAVGDYPGAVAVGDFTGDGTPDLAVANAGSGTVSVLLGNGDGSFQTAVNYDVGGFPTSVAVGDVNGDGLPDLAVANSGSNTVSVLLGNGDGSFQAARSFAAGSGPQSVVLGDFNGDGLQDLAVGDYSGGVSVLLSNGDGSFQAPTSYATGSNVASVAVGDFNADGNLDLAVANRGDAYSWPPDYGSLSVLLGHGDGTFQPAFTYDGNSEAPPNPLSVAVGDFNGDGIQDLALLGYHSYFDGTDPWLFVLLGQGDGSFPYLSFYTSFDHLLEGRPKAVAVGDFNGDGTPDLAVATGFSNVRVFLGNGDGTFPPYGFAARTDYYTLSVAVGDFNGDGWPDLAAGVQYRNKVDVLLNDADWSGPPPPSAHAPPGRHSQAALAAADALPALQPSPLLITDPPPGPSAVVSGPGEIAPRQTSAAAEPPQAPSRAGDLVDQVFTTPVAVRETAAGPDGFPTAVVDELIWELPESPQPR
jgi:hypothetical protein